MLLTVIYVHSANYQLENLWRMRQVCDTFAYNVKFNTVTSLAMRIEHRYNVIRVPLMLQMVWIWNMWTLLSILVWLLMRPNLFGTLWSIFLWGFIVFVILHLQKLEEQTLNCLQWNSWHPIVCLSYCIARMRYHYLIEQFLCWTIMSALQLLLKSALLLIEITFYALES